MDRTRSIAFLLVAALASDLGCTKDPDAIALPRAAAARPSPRPKKQEIPSGTQAPGNPGSSPLTTVGDSTLTGTTRAFRSSDLVPQVSGKLLRVMVKEGDRVRKGQALVQLDPSDFRLAIRQAKAARHTAKTQLAVVKTEWKRLQALLKAKAIPTGDFDKVDGQFQLAQAGLAQAEVAVDSAESSLAKTTIRAPYAAVVTRKMLDEGAYATVMPPSPVVRLEELDRLEVHIEVPEGEMKRVKQGTPVTLRFGAIDRTINAKIDRVIPSVSPQTRSFSAIVALPNSTHELRPGMFVEVSLASGAEK